MQKARISLSDFARHLETQPHAQLWPLAVQLGQGQRQGLEPEGGECLQVQTLLPFLGMDW